MITTAPGCTCASPNSRSAAGLRASTPRRTRPSAASSSRGRSCPLWPTPVAHSARTTIGRQAASSPRSTGTTDRRTGRPAQPVQVVQARRVGRIPRADLRVGRGVLHSSSRRPARHRRRLLHSDGGPVTPFRLILAVPLPLRRGTRADVHGRRPRRPPVGRRQGSAGGAAAALLDGYLERRTGAPARLGRTRPARATDR